MWYYNLFKILFYCFLCMLMILLIIASLNYRSILNFLIYSEVYWMFFYMLSLITASEHSSVEALFVSFLVLYVAALELILIAIIVANRVK